MNHSHVCGDKSSLVAYLYGESEATERQQVEGHLAECTACAAELEALRAVRGTLEAWTPPEPVLGFKIVQGEWATPNVWRRFGVAPAWGLAVAAVVVLAVAAAIAHVEVRYDPDGFVVRTGWASGGDAPERGSTAVTAAADVLLPPSPAAPVLEPEVLPRAVAAPPDRPVAPADTRAASSTIVAEEDFLERVRLLIEESERRQRRDFALGVAEVQQDFDVQRQSDLVQIERRIGWIEGMTGAEIARQREYLDYLVRISQR